jgi:hypothetical protein
VSSLGYYIGRNLVVHAGDMMLVQWSLGDYECIQNFSGSDYLKDKKDMRVTFKMLNFQVLLPSVFIKKILMQVEAV